MDIVPLWFQLSTAIIVDIGSIASIVGYLWPAFAGKETIPELFRRRFSGRQAPTPGVPLAPQPKSQRRAIFNILVLAVPLLIFGGSSAFLGSLFLAHSTGTPTPLSKVSSPTPTLAPTVALTPSPTTVLSPEQAKMQYLHIINTTTPILSDSLTAQDSNAWDTDSNTKFGCGFENDGAYHAFTFHPNVDAECLAKATNFTNNFVYQVKMTTTKGEGGGIIFGSENGTSIKYRFFVNTHSYCDLYVPFNDLHLFHSTQAPITSGLNQPNLIAVMVVSNTIYLFINMQYVGMAETRDRGPLFGQIGLFAVEIGKPTDVAFSELNVWQI